MTAFGVQCLVERIWIWMANWVIHKLSYDSNIRMLNFPSDSKRTPP